MEANGQPQFQTQAVALTRPDGRPGTSPITANAGASNNPNPGGQISVQTGAQGQVQNAAQVSATAVAPHTSLPATGGEFAAPKGDFAGLQISAPAFDQTAPASGSGGQDVTGKSVVLHQPALDQVAVAVQKAFGQGRNQISLRLHPAELGRIDVRLELADDGVLRAHIFAEKPDTLDLLQRDSRALERALQDAGVKTDPGSLAFDLRNSHREGRPTPDGTADALVADNPSEPNEALPEVAASNRPAYHGLLDLSV